MSWNVQETVVVPTHDEEYYLYGFTENGCLVDERVKLSVSYPLWYQVADDSFCVDELVMPEELIHSNARRMKWWKDDEEMGVKNGIYLTGSDTFRVDLFADCDSSSCVIVVKEKRCLENPEESLVKSFAVPECISPDGDGMNDEWSFDFPMDGSSWKCILYDKFGKVLAMYENVPVVWNGTYQGKRMPSTDYWYVILRNEETYKVGHFTLRR